MRQFLTDAEFKVHGQPYAGIPFLVDSEMVLVGAPNEYLFYIAVVKGRTASPRTWRTYGDHLYEYFCFLEPHGLRWDAINQTHLAAWRDLMLSRGCVRTTVNQRLSGVFNFYRWATRSGLIASLPFHTDDVWVAKSKGFLAHVDAKSNRIQANELTLRTVKTSPKFLTNDQARQFVAALTPRRNRLMAYLMWLCGLRREEVVALTLAALPNPAGQVSGQGLRMTLNKTKGCKPRWVLVPYDLAIQLWDYMTFERPALLKKYNANHGGEETERLFLTQYGEHISLAGLNNAFHKASKKSGVKCNPHMLRHSFGTYEYMRVCEYKSKDGALYWVKERMGHSSISMTEVYVHTADLVSHNDLKAYQADICRLLQEDSDGHPTQSN